MKFILTSHARKRCSRRKIKIQWIEDSLENPIRSSVDPDDNSLIHIFYPVPEKGYKVLRVIYNQTVDPVAIITVFFENEVVAP